MYFVRLKCQQYSSDSVIEVEGNCMSNTELHLVALKQVMYINIYVYIKYFERLLMLFRSTTVFINKW